MFFTKRFSVIILLLVMFYELRSQQVLSFPGAEGFGRFALGARGHTSPEVYFVTNLEDSGKGSFRDAVSQPGRVVLFKVSGIIRLKSRIDISPYTTIAGHTAPGDGVVLYGRKVSFSGASHTIARFLRIRLGNNAGATKDEDASGIANGHNIMLDHLSVSWGLDEVFSINWDNRGAEPDSITIQNSIIAQGLHRYNHSAGGLMQTGGRFSILRSLYISNKTRNPKVKGYNEFVNNVVYNFGNYQTTFFKENKISAAAYILGGGSEKISTAVVLNNYFIGGPLTPPSVKTPFSRGNENFNLYARGNYFDNNKNGVLDGDCITSKLEWFPGLTKENLKPESDFLDFPSISPVLTARQAYRYICENAGAVLPVRDQVDAFLVTELESKGKQGRAVFQEGELPFENGGLGIYRSGTVQHDKDGDGIPDTWEQKMGLNENDKQDALAYSKDPAYKGYLNIEVYLALLADQQ